MLGVYIFAILAVVITACLMPWWFFPAFILALIASHVLTNK